MKKSKKGFTLAELLIVVAIIAVLTAIAVPLFVGALNNSEASVKDANIRAVRGAAVVDILQNAKLPSSDPAAASAPTDTYYTVDNKAWVLKGPWYYEAYVSAKTPTEGCTDANSSTLEAKKNKNYKYYVVVKVNTLSTTPASAT